MIELQLSDFEKQNMSEIKKEMLRDELNDLGKLEKNQIGIDIVYMYQNEDEVEVGTFIRNSTDSLASFSECKIQLVNKQNESIVAERYFNLNEVVGEVQSMKGKSASLKFKVDGINEFDKDEYELHWDENLVTGDSVDIEYKFLESIDEGKELIEKYIQTLAPVVIDTVKVDAFSLSHGENGVINLMIMIRNGKERPIAVKRLPIKIVQDGEVVAGGLFETTFIELEAKEGKLFKFPLRKEFIKKEQIKFDRCEILFN